ncbi:hypothetical protein HII36_51855 [Nonomuraea sp. NN258]|uniref:hypothetical protein n=1 Tax=Nonomuraea antri TaxID=2730852 RepID=UPI0015688E73|nr:hypothetical protein [Nonomuraea antri]NRQ40265.1 hypothetical protein [Nonomuraea antri]
MAGSSRWTWAPLLLLRLMPLFGAAIAVVYGVTFSAMRGALERAAPALGSVEHTFLTQFAQTAGERLWQVVSFFTVVSALSWRLSSHAERGAGAWVPLGAGLLAAPYLAGLIGIWYVNPSRTVFRLDTVHGPVALDIGRDTVVPGWSEPTLVVLLVLAAAAQIAATVLVRGGPIEPHPPSRTLSAVMLFAQPVFGAAYAGLTFAGLAVARAYRPPAHAQDRDVTLIYVREETRAAADYALGYTVYLALAGALLVGLGVAVLRARGPLLLSVLGLLAIPYVVTLVLLGSSAAPLNGVTGDHVLVAMIRPEWLMPWTQVVLTASGVAYLVALVTLARR